MRLLCAFSEWAGSTVFKVAGVVDTASRLLPQDVQALVVDVYHAPVPQHWVFKRKADGSFKARVVAQGWNQVPGLDSGSICAPVCMIQSVRIVCCIAVHFGLLLHQMDASTAFLYADIQESVFFVYVTGDRNLLRIVLSRGVVYPRYLRRTELPASWCV